jgi:hypothetical protein
MFSVLNNKCTESPEERRLCEINFTDYSTEIAFTLEMLYNYFLKKLKLEKFKVYIRNR